MVNNLTGIWTVGFDLVYPASAITYDSYSLGPLLKGVPPPSPGRVRQSDRLGAAVTMSRLQPDPSVTRSGPKS